MLMRSTGLGKTQLTGKFVEMQRQGDYLIAQIDVVDPVKWRMRVGLSFRDLARIIALCAKRSVIQLILSPIQWRKKQPKNPGEF